MSTQEQRGAATTVDVKATGHVRRELEEHRFQFRFEGRRLRDFLDAFFEAHGCEELLLAGRDGTEWEEGAASGWASLSEDPPGEWAGNPEGERTRPYARVLVNGRFNELLDGFDTELEDGDRVALVYPFIFCC